MIETDLIKTIQIRINGKAAEELIKKQKADIDGWKSRLLEIGDLISKGLGTPELMAEAEDLRKKIYEGEKQLRKFGTTSEELARTLDNLSGATMKELRASLKNLQGMLNSGQVARGSKEWEEVTKAIRATKEEINRLKAEMDPREFSSVFGSISTSAGGFSTAFTTVENAFQRIASSMEQYVEAWSSVDAAMTGVEKYTGLAREEVEALNEELRKLDTTTSIEGLNALAADAGRLGITSRQQILDFVEAADQINVALGEDLGEGAVKNIGKIAQLFGDAGRMGLKQAMLSTGSVINELAQSSSASEGYLMEFTARLAGVGRQAGLTQAQVMGFASVLDQGMVGVEKGATAMQNVLTLLNSKTAELAGVAGLNVKEFTQLLRTDANEAVLRFIEALTVAHAAYNALCAAGFLNEAR